MPPVVRSCSECGNPLTGMSVTAKTCGNACRLKRSRRTRRANQEIEQFADANNAGANEVAAIVRREAPDVVTKIMGEELRPIVREAMTEDVLRAINGMIGLTPAAVLALQDDLGSENDTIRQRAYTLIIKYTVGHPALVKPEADGSGQQMEVHFNLPRPDAPPPEADADEYLEVDELKRCDMCKLDKPTSEFEAGSDRCTACFEEWKATILQRFGS